MTEQKTKTGAGSPSLSTPLLAEHRDALLMLVERWRYESACQRVASCTVWADALMACSERLREEIVRMSAAVPARAPTKDAYHESHGSIFH
jgi:hypothetical protein